MRSRQRAIALFVASALLFGVLVAGVGAHGGNYGRRYFRFTEPSWSYGGYRGGSRGRGGGGPVRQFGSVGKRATDYPASRPPSDSFFDVRSVTDGGDLGYNGGRGFPGDTNGGRGFPGDTDGRRGFPGDTNGRRGFPGDTDGRRGFPGDTNGGRGFPGDTNGGRGFPGDTNGRRGFPGDTDGGRGFPGDHHGFPENFFGVGGRPNRRPPGGDFGVPGRGGQNVGVAKADDAPARGYDGAPSKGTCPVTRVSCTVYRTRVEHCATDGDCGSRRKCCFDACVQSEVCKTPI